MSLRRYTSNLLNQKLASQQLQEDLIKRQADIEARKNLANQQFLDTAVRGGLSFSKDLSDKYDRDLEKLGELAALSGPGEVSSGVIEGSLTQDKPEPAPPSPRDQKLPSTVLLDEESPENAGWATALPNGDVMSGKGAISTPKEEKRVLSQLTPLEIKEKEAAEALAKTQPITPPSGTKQEPVKPTAPDASQSTATGKTTGDSGKAEVDGRPSATKRSELKPFEPIQWKNSIEDEAALQLQGALDSKKPNVFTNLLTVGEASGKYDLARQTAMKLAMKAVKEARSVEENRHFDRWEKQNKVESERIRAEKEKSPELLAAEIELKKAQAKKAGQFDVKDKNKVFEQMDFQDQALNSMNRLNRLYKTMVGPQGTGLPTQQELQELKNIMSVAAADVDASSASVAGLGGSGSLSQGGKVVDDKIINEAISKIADLNMDEDKKQFMREALLLTQQMGKARENGRMTDADLKFYTENLLNASTPESMKRSLVDRQDDLKRAYKNNWNYYAAKTEEEGGTKSEGDARLRRTFSDPEKYNFKWDFDTDWKDFGYDSKEQLEANKKRWEAGAKSRAALVKQQANIDNLGKRKASITAIAKEGGPAASAFVGGVVNEAGSAIDRLTGKNKKTTEEKPKRRGNF